MPHESEEPTAVQRDTWRCSPGTRYKASIRTHTHIPPSKAPTPRTTLDLAELLLRRPDLASPMGMGSFLFPGTGSSFREPLRLGPSGVRLNELWALRALRELWCPGSVSGLWGCGAGSGVWDHRRRTGSGVWDGRRGLAAPPLKGRVAGLVRVLGAKPKEMLPRARVAEPTRRGRHRPEAGPAYDC